MRSPRCSSLQPRRRCLLFRAFFFRDEHTRLSLDNTRTASSREKTSREARMRSLCARCRASERDGKWRKKKLRRYMSGELIFLPLCNGGGMIWGLLCLGIFRRKRNADWHFGVSEHFGALQLLCLLRKNRTPSVLSPFAMRILTNNANN